MYRKSIWIGNEHAYVFHLSPHKHFATFDLSFFSTFFPCTIWELIVDIVPKYFISREQVIIQHNQI